MKEQKRKIKHGLIDADQSDPFDLFLSATDIRFCYYAETEKILGNTYGMCILQDFEAMTPNILARTIETVEGGGIVVLLLRTVASLQQLYTMSMDVHSRLRTEAHHDIICRFNERFLLSIKRESASLYFPKRPLPALPDHHTTRPCLCACGLFSVTMTIFTCPQ